VVTAVVEPWTFWIPS